jgi:hypothetical protein
VSTSRSVRARYSSVKHLSLLRAHLAFLQGIKGGGNGARGRSHQGLAGEA